MRTLLFGRSGQVGWELERCLNVLGEVVAVDRAKVDLRDINAVRACVSRNRPDVIVNAAGYTNVDGAEANSREANEVNALAPAAMATEARAARALFVHFSTDYVFDGGKAGAWTEADQASPLNAYGRSKLFGEKEIRRIAPPHLILRTSWVYAARGHNFLLTMLRLAREGRTIRVVDDQQGAPTWARFVAQAAVMLIHRVKTEPAMRLLAERGEVVNVTNTGATTWHGFASYALAKYAESTGSVLPRMDSIASSAFAAAAKRPANSLLDTSRLTRVWDIYAPPWEVSCDQVIAEIVGGEE